MANRLAKCQWISLERDGGDDDVQATTTNPQGKYTFESVPAGTYTVSVSVDGEAGSEPVTVAAGDTATADIQLSP
jgi:hypothetical protein